MAAFLHCFYESYLSAAAGVLRVKKSFSAVARPLGNYETQWLIQYKVQVQGSQISTEVLLYAVPRGGSFSQKIAIANPAQLSKAG